MQESYSTRCTYNCADNRFKTVCLLHSAVKLQNLSYEIGFPVPFEVPYLTSARDLAAIFFTWAAKYCTCENCSVRIFFNTALNSYRQEEKRNA